MVKDFNMRITGIQPYILLENPWLLELNFIYIHSIFGDLIIMLTTKPLNKLCVCARLRAKSIALSPPIHSALDLDLKVCLAFLPECSPQQHPLPRSQTLCLH